ncbi:ParA family protein [Leisingera sp. ANG59]|uniref:AAA family ATPase n=1 Tax=Leisingera sp. ANG59 TaxID=2675221 RepID=UPI001574D52B|nr:AAA family ATPase [Leisingera sp. ANG59]
MTQVISVVQEKGGAGKSTLLIALASLMVADGAKVAVIDTDPQHTLSDWAKKESTDVDWAVEEDDERLIPTLRALKKSEPAYDAILVDTAGFKSAMAVYAINASGLVLIPSKATETDAKGAIKTFRHVTSVADSMDKDIPAYVVMMDVDPATNITAATLESLDALKIPRLKAMCAHRTGFKEMMSTGRGPEGSAKRSAQTVLAEMQMGGLIDFYGGKDGKA